MPTSESTSFTYPESFTVAQRIAFERQFHTIQSILKNPKATAAAKEAALRAMGELHNQFSAIGGRIDAKSSTKPAPGVASVRPVAPRDRMAAVESMAAGTKPPPPTPEPKTPAKPTPSTSTNFSGTIPSLSTPTPAAPAATIPADESITPATRVPESGIIPSMETEAAPPPPTESPEMQELRRLISEPTPPPPSGALNIPQTIAYGLLAGLKGIDKVEPMISGQKAAATQKYLLQQNEKERRINNLQNFVSMQEASAERLQTREQAAAATAEKNYNILDSRLGRIRGAGPAAYGWSIAADSMIKEFNKKLDPVSKQTSFGLMQQIAVLNAQGENLANLARTNPSSFLQSDELITQYEKSAAELSSSVQRAAGVLEDQAKAAAAPDPKQAAMEGAAILTTLLRSARRQIIADFGGPINAAIAAYPITSWIAEKLGSKTPTHYAILENTMALITSSINNMKDQGAGKTLTASELELLGGMFLRPESIKTVSLRRIDGLMAWIQVKQLVWSGKATQLEADNILADMVDN